jgi:K+-sensing histidine kinase KdpD
MALSTENRSEEGVGRLMEQDFRESMHVRLAEDLGAEIIRTSSRAIARTLVEIAKARHITQLVLGQQTRSFCEGRSSIGYCA